MRDDYSVRLAARNEGLEYRDSSGTHRFNVSLEGRRWTLYVPGTRGDTYTSHELAPEDQARILPRVMAYLRGPRWLGLFPSGYEVTVEQEPPFSAEDYRQQLERQGYVREVLPDGHVALHPPPLSLADRLKSAARIARAVLLGR